jgi:hypothetical protein
VITRAPRDSKEEFQRRGTEIYEKKIRPLVEMGNHGRYVVIDIESGEIQVGDKDMELGQELIDRNPACQLWMVRIGHRAVERYGFHSTEEKQRTSVR